MTRFQNSLKHGLLAREAVLPTDDLASFRKLERGLNKDLGPGNSLEKLLVDQICASSWRLRRAYEVESDLFTSKMLETGNDSFVSVFEADNGVIEKLMRYKTGIEKSLYKALDQLRSGRID